VFHVMWTLPPCPSPKAELLAPFPLFFYHLTRLVFFLPPHRRFEWFLFVFTSNGACSFEVIGRVVFFMVFRPLFFFSSPSGELA